MEQDLLRVGVIANTHGVHGEVKVYPTTDDINRFKKLKEVILPEPVHRRAIHLRKEQHFAERLQRRERRNRKKVFA